MTLIDESAAPAASGLLTPEEVFAHALRGEPCLLVTPDRVDHLLPVGDWTRPADRSDRALLDLCRGATLDVGCGPGRLTAELTRRGEVALGIDLAREAVAQAVDRGASALHRDVFDRLPGEGRWSTALLADGNIGIGGDPAALLARIHTLLLPDGRVVVETEDPATRSSTHRAHLRCACGTSAEFDWSFVAHGDLPGLARATGFARIIQHRFDGGRSRRPRWVSVLEKSTRSST